jgi:hypothetical protein
MSATSKGQEKGNAPFQTKKADARLAKLLRKVVRPAGFALARAERRGVN